MPSLRPAAPPGGVAIHGPCPGGGVQACLLSMLKPAGGSRGRPGGDGGLSTAATRERPCGRKGGPARTLTRAHVDAAQSVPPSALAQAATPAQDGFRRRVDAEWRVMGTLRTRLVRFLVAWLAAAGVGLACAGQVAYDEARFDASLAQRGGFVVALVADWCTTCSRQQVVVTELLEEPRFRGLTLFVAEFDREPRLRQRLRVALQGTFVVFKDGREVARSTGLTDKAALAALFARAL